MGADATRSIVSPAASRRSPAAALWLGVGAAFAVSLALGLWRIGAKSVWLDEATSVQFAHIPMGTWWSAQVHHEVNSGLYYLLLRGWLTIGRTEADIRLPSALAVALACGALPLLGRRLSTVRVAVLAGILMAVAPVALHYSQEARSYGLVLLLAVVSGIGLVHAVRLANGLDAGRGAAAWAVVVAAAVLGAYNHVLALLGFGAQLLALVALPVDVRRRILKPALVSVITVVVLVSPLVVGLLSTYSSSQQTGVGHPSVRQLGTVTVALTGGSIPAFLAVGVLALCAAATALRRPAASALRVEPELGWFPLTLLVVWAGLPVVGLWAYAFISSQATFTDRYVITVLPPIALLAAAGLVALGRWWRIGAVVFLGLLAVADVRWYHGQLKEDWRHATRTVPTETRPGDGIVFAASYTRVPFAYYAERRSNPPLPQPLFPRQPWTTDVVAEPNPGPAERLVARGQVGGVGRLWLVLSSHDVYANGSAGTPAAEVSFWVPPGWTRVEDHRYSGIEVQLYENRAQRP